MRCKGVSRGWVARWYGGDCSHQSVYFSETLFDRDAGNPAKAQKHGLTLSEIEHAMRTGARIAPDPALSLAEQRFIAIGRTSAGRPVFIAFCFRGERIRPISARYIHVKEVTRYEAAFGSEDDDR
jgi:uncharacterized protein